MNTLNIIRKQSASAEKANPVQIVATLSAFTKQVSLCGTYPVVFPYQIIYEHCRYRRRSGAACA